MKNSSHQQQQQQQFSLFSVVDDDDSSSSSSSTSSPPPFPYLDQFLQLPPAEVDETLRHPPAFPGLEHIQNRYRPVLGVEPSSESLIDVYQTPAFVMTSTEELGFRFEVRPAWRLKQAIEMLCDTGLNAVGVGRIDADGNGVGFTVGNSSDVHGRLWLKVVNLGDFRCSRPVVGKLVDLRKISENLIVDEEDVVVTVAHIAGSNEISFSVGEEPTRAFAIEVLENTVEIPQFPHVTLFCEAAIPCHDVDTLVKQLFQSEGSQLVTVNILAQATLFVGKAKTRNLGSDYEDMGFDEMRRLGGPGLRHHAWFYWPYPEALKKAARLYHAFQLSFASTPPNTVMLRFALQELGDLMFLKEAAKMVPNVDAHLLDLQMWPSSPEDLNARLETYMESPTSPSETSPEKLPEITETSLETPTAILDTSLEHPTSLSETCQEKSPKITETSLETPTSISDTSLENQPELSETSLENQPEVSETSLENPTTVSESSPDNPPAMDEASSETLDAVDEPSKAIPITEQSLETSSADTVSEVPQDTVSEVPPDTISLENPTTGSESSPDNPPAMDEASSETLDTVDEPSKASPITEQSLETPSADRVSEVPQDTVSLENPTIVSESSQDNPPAMDEASSETLDAVDEPSKAIPITEQSLENLSADTVSEVPQDTVSEVPLDTVSLENPITVSESSPDNPPAMDEASSETLDAVDEPSKAIPITEQSLETPSADTVSEVPQDTVSELSQQNPSTDIAGPSQETTPTAVTSEISKETLSPDIAEPSQETPLADIISESSPETQSTNIAGPSQETPSTVAISETSEGTQSTDVAGPSQDISSTVVSEISEETPSIVAISETSEGTQSTNVAGPSQDTSSAVVSEISEETQSADIVGPSQGDPSTDEDSNGFSFQLKPAMRLKLAVEALSDPTFNPTGTGRIDVNVKGFGITAGESRDVHARLWLRAPSLGEFQCSMPVSGKLVNLRDISENLLAGEKDTVTVSYIDGSDKICIIFGEEHPGAFTAEVLENTVVIVEFPQVTIFCEAAIPSYDMDALVQQLHQSEGSQLVSMDILAKATVFVEKDKTPSLRSNYEEMGFDGIRGLKGAEHRHHAWFYWPYPEMLQKAARLYPAFQVSFASKPPNTVILQFSLQELGDLIFLKEAAKMVSDVDASILELQKWPSSLDTFSETSMDNPSAPSETSQEKSPEVIETSPENPTAISDTSAENQPVLSQETPSTDAICEVLKEAQSTDITSQEIPSTTSTPDSSKETQSTDIAGPSQETSSTVAVSEISKGTPSTDIPEPSSQGEPSTDTEGSSQGNPSNDDTNVFSFELKPALRLKRALDVLSDPKLNPSGTGRIDVSENGFGITVGKPRDVHAHLFLRGLSLGRFQCSMPVRGKMVDLREISENLLVDENDTVTVSYGDGSDEICIVFGENPGLGFIYPFLHDAAEIPEFPFVIMFCEAAIPSYDAERIVQHLLQNEGPQKVSVDIMENQATIHVGDVKNLLSLSYDYIEMGFEGTSGMEGEGHRHHAWFYWPYPEVLQKGACLFHAFVISFTTTPPNTVMVRFTLQELGELMFLKEAIKMIPNLDAHLQDLRKKQSSSKKR